MSNETNTYSLGGQPIYHHERTKDFEVACGDEASIEAIVKHFETYIAPVSNVWHEIVSDLVHIDIHVIEPSEDRNYTILFTTGMSDIPMNAPEGMENAQYSELIAVLPADWPLTQEAFENEDNYWPIRWLKMLARLPHEYDSWLWYGHTVPNSDPPMPFGDNTKLCCMLVAPALIHDDYDAFATLRINDEKTIQFFNVLPIFKEEMEFKLRKGADELFDKFEDMEIEDFFKPDRTNVCKRKFPFGR